MDEKSELVAIAGREWLDYIAERNGGKKIVKAVNMEIDSTRETNFLNNLSILIFSQNS